MSNISEKLLFYKPSTLVVIIFVTVMMNENVDGFFPIPLPVQCQISHNVKQGLFKPYERSMKPIITESIHEEPKYPQDFESRLSISYGYYTLNIYGVGAFQSIRSKHSFSDQIFFQSLVESLKERSNPSRSGSKLFVTSDEELILKTIRWAEFNYLLPIVLSGYYKNLLNNPDSVIVKVYGLIGHKYSFCPEDCLIVTENILPKSVHMTEVYDLKGTMVNRKATLPETEKKHPTLLDSEFNEKHPSGFLLNEHAYDRLMEVLKKDCQTLAELYLTDYSMLLGVHYLDKPIPYDPLSKFSTGLPATDKNGRAVMLYFGILDILTIYDDYRFIEHGCKTLIYGENIPLQSPLNYGNRFYKYMGESIFHKKPAQSVLSKL